MNKSIKTSPRATAFAPALMALLISMNWIAWSGCATRVKVISADQTLERIEKGRTFSAPNDGWFMSDALYQRYRRAVADRIMEIQSTNGTTINNN
jgi:hypothetical protein